MARFASLKVSPGSGVLLLNVPDLLRQVIKIGIRRRVTAHIDYHLRDGQSAPPVQVEIKIIDDCNLRCKMCAQWGERGYNFTRPTKDLRNILSLETYRKLVDDIRDLRPWLHIWGGEPFLYHDILPLLTYIKEKGLTLSVATNGTKIKRLAEQLVDIGLDVLIFSIHGPQDTHDNIVQREGAFDAAVSSIRLLQAEKARRNCAKPLIFLISAVSRDNVRNLECVFDLGEELRVDGILVNYGWFQTPGSVYRYTCVMQEKLDTTPWSCKGWLWDVHTIDPDPLIESVNRIKARTYRFSYKFFPDLAYEDISRYYRDHACTFGRKKCLAPWVKAEIMPNGDVVMCGEYPDYVVGNIKHDNLLDIWNSQRSQKFRRILKGEGGLLPVCVRCPSLMGW